MIPQNESDSQRQRQGSSPGKELSWMDRMQLKLDTLCESDAGRNSTEVIQETSAYLENQISSLGTNMRKFCAEFVQELLLPPDSDDKSEVKSEVSRTDNPQAGSAQTNGGHNGDEKSVKVVENLPAFNLEVSSTDVMPLIESEKAVQIVKVDDKVETEKQSRDTPLHMTPSSPTISRKKQVVSTGDSAELPELPVLDMSASTSNEEDAEQYAHWFVNEEYRKMRLGKSTSTSSIESWSGHQRAGSCDSDWELV